MTYIFSKKNRGSSKFLLNFIYLLVLSRTQHSATGQRPFFEMLNRGPVPENDPSPLSLYSRRETSRHRRRRGGRLPSPSEDLLCSAKFSIYVIGDAIIAGAFQA